MASNTEEVERDAFRLDPTASVNGTSGLTRMQCLPVELVEMFGKPRDGDGHKVSGEYVFTNDDREVFAVYDWKQTSLYFGRRSGCPSPEEFWTNDEFVFLSVGGRRGSDVDRFLTWLVDRMEDHQADLQQQVEHLERSEEEAELRHQ